MEARSGRSDDVAVRLLLDELHRLLLLQNQEAVELSSCLLLVVVPAQIQQADRLGTCFGHHPLWQHGRESEDGKVFYIQKCILTHPSGFGASIDRGLCPLLLILTTVSLHVLFVTCCSDFKQQVIS